MRAAPKLTQFYKYPVVVGISILAISSTLAWWMKFDISPLFETAMIRRGEFWRLLTSILPHVNILHLVFNLYWFWSFGTLVEETLGHLKTAALILFLALGSGAMEFALADGGVGLSGVVYGLFGMLWVLTYRDQRFHDAIDLKTAQLFVGWFIFCVIATVAKWYAVGNIAHAAGSILGALLAIAISVPERRHLASLAVGAIVLLGCWGSTLGRPKINLSAQSGYEEGKWGYDALQAGRNQDAIRWLSEAVVYKPKLAVYWFDLGIAYQRAGNTKNAKSAYERAHQLEPSKAEYVNPLEAIE